MTNTSPKLERGAQLLHEAGGDQDLLGVALLAFQGALDLHLHVLLGTNTSLSVEDQTLLADSNLPLSQLVDLARRYGDLNREQAWRILEAERLRVAFSSGEPFRGSPSEMRAYGRFVAEICGDTQLAMSLANIPITHLATKQSDNELEDEDADPVPVGPYYTIMRWVPGMLLIVLLVVGVWSLLGRVSPANQASVPDNEITPDVTNAPVSVKATSAPPDATLGPVIVSQGETTVIPSPTAAAHQGRVVRLGGGPGWLHESARFDSPTLPIRLSEGQIVAMLGQQQNDEQGTPWIYVAIGGYEGWSPLNNIEEVR